MAAESKSSSMKWVTVNGRHVPVPASGDKSVDFKKLFAGTKGTKTSGAGGGSSKKQLAKKDELKSLKGPKLSKKK